MHALQTLALKLTDMSPSNLDDMPIGDALKKALIDYKKISSNSAKRRQAQYLGKLMRGVENLNELKQVLGDIENHDIASNAHFHLCERWRTRLLEEGKLAMTAFFDEYPETDAQQLRQLIKKTLFEKEKSQNAGAYKALFRFIKEVI